MRRRRRTANSDPDPTGTARWRIIGSNLLILFAFGLFCALPLQADDDPPKVAAEVDTAFSFEFGWTTDVFGITGFGSSHATTLHNVDVMLGFEGNDSFWRGGRAFVYLLGNTGGTLTEPVGDLQGIDNIEAPRAVRLYEAWVEQDLAGGRAGLLVGLFDLNSEFYATERADLFIHPSHGIGSEMAQSGEAGPSIFPLTSLTARLRVDLGAGITTRLAVLDAVPGSADDPAALAFRINSQEGFLVVGEMEYSGPLRVVGGYWQYSRAAQSDWSSADLASLRSRGAYVLAEGDLLQWGETGNLGLFGRVGVADPDAYAVDLAWGGGVSVTGLLASRGEDRIGAALAVAGLGDPFVQNQMGTAPGLAAAEAAFEVVYQAAVSDRVSVSLDAQAIRRPGGAQSSPTVYVLGQRFSVSF